MKVGVRTPNIKGSVSARTTGRANRTLKRMVNPFYGKKGMGWLRNPKKAAYNKIYHKTTISTKNLVGLLFACIWYPMYWAFIIGWWGLKVSVLLLWGALALCVNGIIALVEWIINLRSEKVAELPAGTVDRTE